MLTATYSWVRFPGACTRLTDAKIHLCAHELERLPKLIVRAMKHPQSAVMVNIFMPCELMRDGLAGFGRGWRFMSPAPLVSMFGERGGKRAFRRFPIKRR